ncbi:MAG TPA: hypothetical protein VI072_17435 [Polyangiaceae bacterium]
MTRKQKWVIATVVVVGCGGAAVTHQVLRRTASVATDSNGQPLSCIKDLTLGGSHTCVLFHNGRVHCFGHADTVGTGDITVRSDHYPVKTNVRFSTTAAGYKDTCGLKRQDGSVWCWGTEAADASRDRDGRFPVHYTGLGKDNVSLGLATDRVCTLKKDASVWCETLIPESSGRVAKFVGKALVGVAKLYVRNSFACAKMKDGQVQCWGSNLAGQLGRGTASDANLGVWSEPPAPILNVGKQLTELRMSAIAACGITSSREAWCWGGADYSIFADNRYWKGDDSGDDLAQTVPMKLNIGMRFRDLVLGSSTACIIADNRSVWCWGGAGWNDMLGEPSVTFKRDNAVVSLEPRPRKLKPLGRDNQRIWAGGAHYCVQKTDQSIWCWGANLYGQVNRDIRKHEYDAPLSRLPVACPPP